MADQDRPNQNANKEKAEGGRPERQYPGGDTADAGGITNRPLTDEVENQEHLPERGTRKNREDEDSSGE